MPPEQKDWGIAGDVQAVSRTITVRMTDDTVSRLQGWSDEELRRSQHVFPFHSMPELVRFDFEAWDVIERDYKGSVYLRLR